MSEPILDQAETVIAYEEMQLNHYSQALAAYDDDNPEVGDQAVQLQIAWDTNRIANALEAIALGVVDNA